MRRRAFLGRVAGFGGLCGVGTAGYAWGVEPHWPEVVRRELPVEALPEELDGAVLVQVSDLHVGPESTMTISCPASGKSGIFDPTSPSSRATS
jgi:predicted MPP superfamily phosphohydrolase